MILAIFENTKISLGRIHHWKRSNDDFSIQDAIQFHSDCDNKGIQYFNNYINKNIYYLFFFIIILFTRINIINYA